MLLDNGADIEDLELSDCFDILFADGDEFINPRRPTATAVTTDEMPELTS